MKPHASNPRAQREARQRHASLDRVERQAAKRARHHGSTGGAMTARIHKYPLLPMYLQTITTERVLRWLWAGWQGEQLCVWAEVDTASEVAAVQVCVAMTGDALPRRRTFIGTAATTFAGEPFVAHVYEVPAGPVGVVE